MGAEGAVEIVFRKQVQEAEDPDAKRRELIDAYRKIIDVYVAAGNDMIDDVIDPRETRLTICRALEMSAASAWSARSSARGWCRSERARPGAAVVIACAISGAIANREQCPAIPYTPQEYAAEARRIVDEGGVHIHVHARRPDGTPSYEIEDSERSGMRSARRSATPRSSTSRPDRRRPGRQARRVPGGLPAGGGGTEHGIAQLRQVLAHAPGLRVPVRVHQPIRRDHRTAAGDARAADQARARMLRRRARRLAGAARRHGPARRAAARRLRDGDRRRVPATARNLAAMADNLPPAITTGGDRDRPRPVDDGRRRADPGGSIRVGWRTTSTCPTGRWRAPTAI